jgi:hypothetical protein
MQIAAPEELADPNIYQARPFGIFMGYWYASLFVVIEGWEDLNEEDEVLQGLLKSPNTALLKRFRNAVFHYQKNYRDPRLIELISEGNEVVEWIWSLDEAFSAFFFEFFNTQHVKE